MDPAPACRHHPRAAEGSPAHAGMDPPSITSSVQQIVRGLPRPRGDGPFENIKDPLAPTAPPPTRGWTPLRPVLPCAKRRLPRPRGDGPIEIIGHDIYNKAPPPTRGWTLPRRDCHQCRGGSPAHAGMDPNSHRHPLPSRRLPRPRGDGPPFPIGPPALVIGSPAHAGMHPLQGPMSRPGGRSRLPRPRGDGPCGGSTP